MKQEERIEQEDQQYQKGKNGQIEQNKPRREIRTRRKRGTHITKRNTIPNRVKEDKHN